MKVGYERIVRNAQHLKKASDRFPNLLSRQERSFLVNALLKGAIGEREAYFLRKLIGLKWKEVKEWPVQWSMLPELTVPDSTLQRLPPSIYYHRGFYIIKVRGEAHLVKHIKEKIPNRYYEKEGQFWKAPATSWQQVLAFQRAHNYAIEPDALARMGEAHRESKATESATDPYSGKLKKNLYSYQVDGVTFMVKNRYVLNGDEMGTGKTIQAIASVVNASSRQWPCLVLCPASMKLTWQSEWAAWTDRRVVIAEKGMSVASLGMVDVLIMNYEVAHSFAGMDPKHRVNMEGHFKSVILDEAHRAKNPKSRTYQACEKLVDGSNYTFLLSGTPLLNKASELIPLLNLINRMGMFGGEHQFRSRYCTGKMAKARLPELKNKLLKSTMIRRLKRDVLTELEPKTRQVCPVPLSGAKQKEYALCRDDFEGYLRGRGLDEETLKNSLDNEDIVKLHHLKRISGEGKVEAAADFIRTITDAGEKVLVFAHHKTVIGALEKCFPKADKIVGGLKPEEKQRAMVKFQEDPSVKVILLGIEAAGVGLTLTAAKRVVFTEFPWTPGACDQAEDRAHRKGQAETVSAYYLAGAGTVDDTILKVIARKREIFDAAIGDEEKEFRAAESMKNIVAEVAAELKKSKHSALKPQK